MRQIVPCGVRPANAYYSVCRTRFAPITVVVRALLWPKAEELRIGIVADIATATARTKATAVNAQTNAAAGANSPDGPDAPFGVLLQQLAQPATAADPAGRPVAQTGPQDEPQASRQTSQDISNMIALLRSDALQQSQTATSQSGGAALVMDPSSGAALDAAATNDPISTADAVPQFAAQNDAKPAAKNDQTKEADTDSTADPKTAPDNNLLAALTQQMQAAAIQPQAAPAQVAVPSDDATAAVKVAAAGAAPVAPDGKPMPARPQTPSGTGATATSDQAASGDTKQTGTDGSGALTRNTPDIDALKTDAKGNAGPGRPANPQDAAPAQDAQSSVSGQSANAAAPSVAATAVQTQVQTATVASANVNFQVAPQHRDATSTPTLDTLAVTIAAKSADGIKHFDIRLDPPELGRVQVHLSLDDLGKAQASLVVDRPQTLELLQRDAASLTRSLHDAGVSLSNNGLNFSLRGQDRQNEGGGVVKGRSRALSVKADIGTDAISNSSSIASFAPGGVRLDIRV